MTDKRKEQRERLLQAAYDLVADVGVSGLRTRDIAERAGVNIATLHYCFAGKDALLQALYEFIRDKFRAEVDERLGHERTSADKIRAHIELRAHFVQDEMKSLQVWRAFLGEAWVNPTIREIVRRSLADQRGRMAEIIAEGRSSGDFPNLPTPDDKVAASLVMALFEGILFQYAMDTNAFLVSDYAQAIYTWLGMKPV